MNSTITNTQLEPRLLTLLEAAGRLRVSHSLVRRLVKRGDLPAVKVGRRVLIDTADVAGFIDQAKGPKS